MASGFSLVGLILSIAYIGLAVMFAVFADRIYKSRPIGLWGDVAAAAVAVGAFAIFLGDGWRRMLLELNDSYPDYFAVAYMPIVAFVAVGFVRSLAPLLPVRAAGQMPVVAMAAGPDLPGNAAPQGSSASPSASPAVAATETTPASPGMKWLKRIGSVAVLAVMVLVGVAKFATRNDLPGCDSRAAKDTLSDIYQSKKIDVKRYDEIKTNSTTEAMIGCTASITLADNAGLIFDYEIVRLENKDVQVRIKDARNR